MDTPTFERLGSELQKTLRAEVDEIVVGLRDDGWSPTATVPAWYVDLPVDVVPRWSSPGAPLGSGGIVYDREAAPLELVIEELRQIMAAFQHGFLFDAALADLPGLAI